ncbi:DUF427 domain-containing protein [Flagellimonas lutimaris]|jgi:uncharacterized protein (DUF427 family)|nr:DUF427 domain-containing protein [Allomuricauda lutimaris]|tara:strand:+ start:2478 stop:2759 length:282 start_codon:yes stop_codon:yes gene_type:complete
MKAIWNNQIVAESADTILIENNHYFPPESIHSEYFKDSDTSTSCHWKGTAEYKTLVVDGAVNEDAAWYYPEPSALAKGIKDYFAFWKGVKIEE